MVISIISIMAVSVFVALNPVKRSADARNSRRWSDVDTLLTATHQYIVDNKGALPPGVDTTVRQLGTCASGGATLCAGANAACLDLTTPFTKYLKSVPVDSNGTAATTGYSIVSDANGIVTVNACAAENAQVIQVSR